MKRSTIQILIILALIVPVAMVIGSCASMQGKSKAMIKMPVAIKGATYEGTDACADCHEDLVKQFKGTIHGRLADFEVKGHKGCESCHGPGSVHIENDGDTTKIIRFSNVGQEGGMTPGEASAICLQCHSKDAGMDWRGNEHALNDVTCVDCHKIHQDPAKGTLKMPEPELCYRCHQDIRAKVNYPSHHPIREGKMKCSDCHDNHGSSLHNLKTEERVNDLCYRCHADKQGPFTYQHAPVEEDCTICHDPHGAVADNLLKQNEPFLCLQCHHLHFHATFFSPNPQTGASRVTPNPHSSQMAMGTRCTQCHSQIHGSDLPSLSTPGQGKALTR